MTESALVGVWKLLACEGRSLGGEKSFLPYGENPSGRLFYDKCGKMSVLLMATGRPSFTSDDISKAGVPEILGAFSSFDAYSGAWTCIPSEKIVNHHIECAKIPNWVGHVHQRTYEVTQSSLVLTTEPFEMGGETWQVRVSWDREDG